MKNSIQRFHPFGFNNPLSRAERARYWKAKVELKLAEIKLHESLSLSTSTLKIELRQLEQRYIYNRNQVRRLAAAA